MTEDGRNDGNGEGAPAEGADGERVVEASLEEVIARAEDPDVIRREEEESRARLAEDKEYLQEQVETYFGPEAAAEETGAPPPSGGRRSPVRYRPSGRPTPLGEMLRQKDAVGESVEAGRAGEPAGRRPEGAEPRPATDAPAEAVPERAEGKEEVKALGATGPDAVLPGRPNGAGAAGGTPDRAGESPPGRADGTDSEISWPEFLAAFNHKMDVLVHVNTGTLDKAVAAMESFVVEMRQAIPTMEKEEVAMLLVATGDLKEYLRVSDADRLRRREVREYRFRWPLRGLAAAGAVALLLAGAAGEARWSVLDGSGLLEGSTNGWRDIVWRAHGEKIVDCMIAAKQGSPARVCAVDARLR